MKLSKILLLNLMITTSIASAQAQQSLATKGWSDGIIASFKGIYFGPSLGSPSGLTPDGAGILAKKAQYLDTTLTFGYAFIPNTTVGFSLNLNLYPFTAGANQAGASMKAPNVLLSHSKLLNGNGFNLASDIRLYAPIGDVAIANKLNVGFRTTQTLTYQASASPWVFGTQAYVRFWSYGPASKASVDSEFMVSPFMEHRFSDKFRMTVWSDAINMAHKLGSTEGLVASFANVQPGVRWDFSKNFYFNPYLNILPGNLDIKASSLGMIIGARV